MKLNKNDNIPKSVEYMKIVQRREFISLIIYIKKITEISSKQLNIL